MTITTLSIEVRTREEARAEMLRTVKAGKPAKMAHHYFHSSERFFEVLNANRWNLIKAMTGAGPIGVRELARRVGRDVKGVHTDVQALVACGLVNRADDTKYSFPYNEVNVHFAVKMTQAA